MSRRLKPRFEKKKAAGKSVKVAMTFPGGTHDLWIRYWLAAGGIDPDKDIETIVVPPPQMVANMKVGTMDAFCVGEPWTGQLVHQKIGYTAVDHRRDSGTSIRRSRSACARPGSTRIRRRPRPSLMAVMEAQQWGRQGGERRKSSPPSWASAQWINCPVEDILDRAKGKFDYGTGKVVENSPHIMKYWEDFASYPFQSHDLWFMTEDIRWGKYEPGFDAKALIAKVNREDIWRDAAKTHGRRCRRNPTSTSRGKETFFDGKVFDPKSGSLPQVARHQARRRDCCLQDRCGLAEMTEISAMNMQAIKTGAGNGTGEGAGGERRTGSRQAVSFDRCAKMAKDSGAVVRR